jgi:D-alanine transaminase
LYQIFSNQQHWHIIPIPGQGNNITELKMSRIVYLNGEYMPAEQAKVSIFDRAVLLGDAIYEVAGVLDGKLIDFSSHMSRLLRSLTELDIAQPMTAQQILDVYRKLVEMNNLHEGLVYLQVSRGVAERDFTYEPGMIPTVFMFTQETDSSTSESSKTGVALKSVPDIRWARRDIKSVNLLGQVLAKQAAHDAGAYEALMIGADGNITECGATSFFIFKNNTIITRPLSNDILSGVTRKAIVELCEVNQLQLDERLFTLEEAMGAEEAFITGASTFVLPVTEIDDQPIGTGEPGPAGVALRKIYLGHARETAI